MLDEMCNLVCDRLEDYLDHLSVDLRRQGSKYVGSCPVHGGRNRGAVSMWNDEKARGNWQCRSNKCESYFSRSLLGFTHGVISHEKCGWSGRDDRKASGKLAVDFMCKFLGVRFEDIEIDPARVARRKFARTVEILAPSGRPVGELCTKEAFHGTHRIPSSYYLSRGFTESTLRKFEVGDCTYKASPSYGRTNIPIYDADGKMIVGVLSRSPHPRCPECRDCHAAKAACLPEDAARERSRLRWLVNPLGFNDKHHLYNLWRARPIIVQSKCIVIAEGAGDVWRLDEAGILNAVGLMGSSVSTLQDIMIEECTPAHVVIMTDDDDAGNAAADAIEKKWRRYVGNNVHRLKPIGATEISEMKADDVRRHYRGLIEGWMK